MLRAADGCGSGERAAMQKFYHEECRTLSAARGFNGSALLHKQKSHHNAELAEHGSQKTAGPSPRTRNQLLNGPFAFRPAAPSGEQDQPPCEIKERDPDTQETLH